MSYTRGQMIYNDGKYYKWTAKADHDNPNYRVGKDRAELDRTEGYEILPFINLLGDQHFDSPVHITTYQKIEKMIRYDVPHNIRTHKEIGEWIDANWNNDLPIG